MGQTIARTVRRSRPLVVSTRDHIRSSGSESHIDQREKRRQNAAMTMTPEIEEKIILYVAQSIHSCGAPLSNDELAACFLQIGDWEVNAALGLREDRKITQANLEPTLRSLGRRIGKVLRRHAAKCVKASNEPIITKRAGRPKGSKNKPKKRVG